MYNHFLKEAAYRPAILCKSSSGEYVVAEIKGTQSCVRRVDADTWKGDDAAIKAGIAVFLFVLFVPAFATRRISFKGWNRN